MSTVTNINEKRDSEELVNGKIPKRFLVNLKGKDFILYEGLLELAHQKGLKSLKTELVQMPTPDNGYLALMKATLVGKDGTEFEDYGDASPKSVTSMIVPHIIRMASTRAKARTLRDFTNIGMTSIDELGDDNNITSLEGEVELLTKKQRSILEDNFDKISNLFGSIEDIAALPKDKATELIGEYIFNKNSSDKENKGNASNESKGNNKTEKSQKNKSQNNKSTNDTNKPENKEHSKEQPKEQPKEQNKSQETSTNNSANNSKNEDTQSSGTVEKATKGQVSYVGILTKQLAAKKSSKQEDIVADIKNEHSVKEIADLSKDAITKLIDDLKKQLTVA